MTSNDSKYNGWTNYETWCVNLWYDDAFTEDAEEIYADAEPEYDFQTKADAARIELADRIKESVEELSGLPDTGMAADLLNASMSRVNWYEIAGHYIDEIADDE